MNLSQAVRVTFSVSALVLMTLAAQGSVAGTQPSCGVKGTIKERIADCAKKNGKSEGNFVLVSRTQNLKREVRLDRKTGFLWTDAVVREPFTTMSGFKALNLCGKVDLEEYAEIQTQWYLPTLQDCKTAIENGFAKEVPNPGTFWTSTEDGRDSPIGYICQAHASQYDTSAWEDEAQVRCMAFPYGL